MTYILVIWTIVAAANNGWHYDYRPIGEFTSEATCKVAGEQLKITPDRPYRCLKK